MEKDNKKILINTIVMYSRLIITTIIGLLTSRYVLQALGQSDFGLYAVVGGIIAMLGVVNTAMHTTTRRYINVEMGKPDGDLTRIFNVSRLLHYGFAVFILLLAETIGMFYIYNYLNVSPEKFTDAVFVFQISTISAAIGIVNIPYQALLQAFEKFTQVALFDVILSVTKLSFVLCILLIDGDVLRIYAIGMSCLTLLELLLYNIACKIQWADIIQYKFYKESKVYKEILYFNNYVALGATAYIGRSQGSNILVNYFFGTLVNAAFAIGYTIENYCMIFIGNVGSAAMPQIAKNYALNNERSVFLTELLNKFSIYLLLIIIVPLSLEMDFVLKIWLNDVPEGTTFICQLTLISALTRTMFGGMDKLIQASGKIRWFQVVGSIMEVSCLLISFVLYKFLFPAYTVIIVFIIMTALGSVVTFSMMKQILHFDIVSYAQHVLLPSLAVVVALSAYAYVYIIIFKGDSFLFHVSGIVVSFFVTIGIIFLLGLAAHERHLLYSFAVRKN